MNRWKFPYHVMFCEQGSLTFSIFLQMITIFDALPYLNPDGPVKSKYLKSMEDLNQSYGFILYRTKIISSDLSNKITIKIDALRDRSVIMVDQVN